MKRVAYHRLAAKELTESALFYDQRRIGLGEAFLTEVEGVLALIRGHPELGQPGIQHTRSSPIRRFPFRIVYEVQPDRIGIVAVAHLSRRPGYWGRRMA